MTKTIISKDTTIPDQATFECHNCHTKFETDEFDIHATSKYLGGIGGWFSNLYKVKLIYELTSECPACGYSAEVEIDRGIEETRHFEPSPF